MEENSGVMVSVTDNFDLKSVPFNELIDPDTLRTRLRDVPRGSDFYTLKERLTYKNIFE
jgi:6-phosphofructokinase 1